MGTDDFVGSAHPHRAEFRQPSDIDIIMLNDMYLGLHDLNKKYRIMNPRKNIVLKLHNREIGKKSLQPGNFLDVFNCFQVDIIDRLRDDPKPFKVFFFAITLTDPGPRWDYFQMISDHAFESLEQCLAIFNLNVSPVKTGEFHNNYSPPLPQTSRNQIYKQVTCRQTGSKTFYIMDLEEDDD